MSKIEVNEIDAQSGSTITVGSACKSIAIPGNVVKTNAVQASDGGNIISQCGATITLGASGDTVTLASGSSQSGFGRTGTVNWDTTKKTASFTAVSGEGYFVDTSSAAITVTLPASPSQGDIVAVADYAGTAGTNAITLARNGSNFEGAANDGQITGNRNTLTVVYVDATQGWVPVNENVGSSEKNIFISATGGTVTTCGDFKIHTFTGPGTFCVSAGAGPVAKVDYVIVAGGGGAGGSTNPGGGGGGGGAGGYRESHCATTSGPYTASPLANPTSLPISPGAIPVTVGAGGAGGPPNVGASFGNDSIFSTITAFRGGYGGMNGPGFPSPYQPQPWQPAGRGRLQGGLGGSGGGAAIFSGQGNACGNTPPVSPPQGSPGGDGGSASQYGGGGGGGATAAGADANPNGGNGGAGATSSITGSPVTRAGGGGGASTSGTDGSGGSGGGGNATSPGGTGGAGSTNTGGGGGAGGSPTNATGGAGGSGIVIIRYKFQ
tara:strand:- start:1644 stop:3122 length:1479 start_codon:yes stop_codon:yes gene_type:complete